MRTRNIFYSYSDLTDPVSSGLKQQTFSEQI